MRETVQLFGGMAARAIGIDITGTSVSSDGAAEEGEYPESTVSGLIEALNQAGSSKVFGDRDLGSLLELRPEEIKSIAREIVAIQQGASAVEESLASVMEQAKGGGVRVISNEDAQVLVSRIHDISATMRKVSAQRAAYVLLLQAAIAQNEHKAKLSSDGHSIHYWEAQKQGQEASMQLEITLIEQLVANILAAAENGDEYVQPKGGGNGVINVDQYHGMGPLELLKMKNELKKGLSELKGQSAEEIMTGSKGGEQQPLLVSPMANTTHLKKMVGDLDLALGSYRFQLAVLNANGQADFVNKAALCAESLPEVHAKIALQESKQRPRIEGTLLGVGQLMTGLVARLDVVIDKFVTGFNRISNHGRPEQKWTKNNGSLNAVPMYQKILRDGYRAAPLAIFSNASPALVTLIEDVVRLDGSYKEAEQLVFYKPIVVNAGDMQTPTAVTAKGSRAAAVGAVNLADAPGGFGGAAAAAAAVDTPESTRG